MKKKPKELEQEYLDIEGILPEVDPPEPVDSISPASCAQCGTRLTRTEWEEFEDVCEECLWDDTSGLIDDDPESEIP